MIRSLSIRRQVAFITAGVTATVLAVVLLITLTVVLDAGLERGREATTTVAHVIGSNLSTSIEQEDRKAAAEIVQALSNSSEIQWARVYLPSGDLFADYRSVGLRFGDLSKAAGPQLTFEKDDYIVGMVEPVMQNGRRIGTMVIWVDTWPTYSGLFSVLWLALAVWLFGTVTAYLLAHRLNSSVIRPLADLTTLMRHVSRDENYTRRFEYEGSNEVGVLGESFNQMLGQIQDREDRLQSAIVEIEQARDAAEAAARSKSSFLANMSHEIRTPMNGVVSMTSLLKRTPLSDQQQLYFGTIEKSAKSLLMIINDILDFTKIEAGRLEIKTQPFDLHEIIESLAVFFDPSAQQKGITFAAEVAPELPTQVIGDPGRVRQVLLNLLSNAIKFTLKGGVRLDVTLAGTDHAQRIHFAVTDTGVGIAKEKQSDVFSEFFQEDSSSTRQFGGTGLGLAISRQLAILMGGSMGFRSEAGQGSVFWFEMPLESDVINPFLSAQAAQSSTPKALKGESRINDGVEANPFATAIADGSFTGGFPGSSDAESTPQWNIKVLVAEDSEVNQFIIRELLASFGVVPRVVPNGAEALKAFADEDFDLVLMDVQMPVMDGVEATEKLRELQADRGTNPDCLIVGLSAHAMTGDRQKYIDRGMDDYLTKPVELEALEAMFKRHFTPMRPMALWR